MEVRRFRASKTTSKSKLSYSQQQQLSHHHLTPDTLTAGNGKERRESSEMEEKNYHLTVWSDFRLISVTKEFISNNRLIKVECNFKLLALLIFIFRSLSASRAGEFPQCCEFSRTRGVLWIWGQFPMSKRIRWEALSFIKRVNSQTEQFAH